VSVGRSATEELAKYLADFQPTALPARVMSQAKLVTIDAIGNAIGGLPFELADTFCDLARTVGGGSSEATIIGSADTVSAPFGSFANTALSTMLDYSDWAMSDSGRCPIWIGPLAVPAALAAGEVTGISGAEFFVSVAAGYECAARVLHSMDMSVERSLEVNGETLSVFAAVGAAGRALRLSHEGMLSAIAMAGIYTPVPAYYKWIGDEGLTPRKDIKQGWAWMSMTGTFAAVSAQKGLRAIQKNNILDGDRGLWRMLGMDEFDEARITEGFGSKFYIDDFGSKPYPGCAFTFTAVEGAVSIVRSHGLDPTQIDRIEVITNRSNGTGFDDQVTESIADMQFNFPHQIAAAIALGERGPSWYTESASTNPELIALKNKVHVAFDDESERIFRETGQWMSKVAVTTTDGEVHRVRVDNVDKLTRGESIREKFLRTSEHVVGRERAEAVLATIEDLDGNESLDALVESLSLPRLQRAS
jgi:2-methylcitrate dehydratase PrpD